jgi:nitrogen fixation NifU-like protein
VYTEKLTNAFQKPKHVGEIKDADIIGKAGNPICGDVMWIYVKLKKDSDNIMERTIEDMKFKTMGCAAAIGTSEIICQLGIGMKLKDAKNITKQDIIDAVDGLPPPKVHCSILATEALKNGIKELEKKREKIK